MGRNSGVEYRTLSEEEDEEPENNYPPVNGVHSPFTAVPLHGEEEAEAEDAPAREEMGSGIMDEHAGDGDSSVEDYWSSQSGFSWLLVLIVRALFLGKRSVIVLIVFIAVGIGLFVTAVLIYPITLETSLSSFQIPDHIVYTREDAFEKAIGVALSTRNSKFSSGNGRRKRAATYIYRGGTSESENYIQESEQKYEKWKINLVYRTTDASNILQRSHIERIHEVERQIENFSTYTQFCWLDWSQGSLNQQPYPPSIQNCFPMNSLMTYFYPTTGRSNGMAYGGDVMAVIRNAWSSADFFWYLDSSFSEQNPTSKLMRSQIILGYPLHGSMTAGQQHQAAKDYIVSLIPLLSSLSNKDIQVLYGSADIYDYQVLSAAYSDIRLSIISVCIIGIFVFILTSFSPFLTFICLEAVAMSLPLAYFVYRVLAGVDTFGLLNIISLFVLTGIGVDDGFMFINTFRQAPEWARYDVGVRLHYTLYTAGKATLFTSATTAAAFFANLASGIPAVHNFGLFMGLVVVMCYLTVVVQMPAALYLWQTYMCRQKRSCLCCPARCTSSGCCSGGSSAVAETDMELMSSEPRLLAVNGEPSAPPQSGAWTDGALSVRVTGLSPPKWTLTEQMAKFIQRFIAKPVIRFRYLVIVVFVVLFAVSIGLVTRLRTAEKPPQFFPSNSNLQQFIDLAYNTSQMNVDCSKCSGYFHPSGSIHNNLSSLTTLPTVPPTDSTNFIPWTFIPNPDQSTQQPSFTSTQPIAPVTSRHISTVTSQRAEQTTRVRTSTNDGSPHLTTVAHTATETAPKTSKSSSHTTKTSQSSSRTTKTSQSSLHPTVVARATTEPAPGTSKVPTQPTTEAAHATTIVHTQSPNEPTEPHRPRTEGPHPFPATSQTPEVNTVDRCSTPGKCKAQKPSLSNTANVYIVFGIKSLIRNHSADDHITTSSSNKDTVVYDPNFASALSQNILQSQATVNILCNICLAAIEPHRGLVLKEHGAYECVPKDLQPYLLLSNAGPCSDPRLQVSGDAVSAHAFKNETNVLWLAMGFKSNVYQGGSSFKARDEYDKWENFMDEVHRNYSNPAIQSSYQTSEFWKQVFLEVVAVTSALYSIALSALLCLIFVAVFTGCPLLTLVTLATVGCIACFVLAVFYMLGWHLGAVEAISMSILIGTAVDYCVHLVEGYLVARRHIKGMSSVRSKPWIARVKAHVEQSCRRALWSLSHVGLSIVSSALTTLFASLPLCFAQIQLLARFGQIMFINTLVSIVLTSTACCALLSCQPQWRFPGTWKASFGGFIASGVICGLLFLALYLIHLGTGVGIPAPDGSSLF